MPQAVRHLGWIFVLLVCASPVAANGHAAAEAAREEGMKSFQRGALDDAAAPPVRKVRRLVFIVSPGQRSL